MITLMEHKVSVRCLKRDVTLVASVVDDASEEFRKLVK